MKPNYPLAILFGGGGIIALVGIIGAINEKASAESGADLFRMLAGYPRPVDYTSTIVFAVVGGVGVVMIIAGLMVMASRKSSGA